MTTQASQPTYSASTVNQEDDEKITDSALLNPSDQGQTTKTSKQKQGFTVQSNTPVDQTPDFKPKAKCLHECIVTLFGLSAIILAIIGLFSNKLRNVSEEDVKAKCGWLDFIAEGGDFGDYYFWGYEALCEHSKSNLYSDEIFATSPHWCRMETGSIISLLAAVVCLLSLFCGVIAINPYRQCCIPANGCICCCKWGNESFVDCARTGFSVAAGCSLICVFAWILTDSACRSALKNIGPDVHFGVSLICFIVVIILASISACLSANKNRC